jgi:hypothetical protein
VKLISRTAEEVSFSDKQKGQWFFKDAKSTHQRIGLLVLNPE